MHTCMQIHETSRSVYRISGIWRNGEYRACTLALSLSECEPSGDHIEIGDLTSEGTVNQRQAIVFSPLHTSDRGEYTCTGRIATDSVEWELVTLPV